MAFQTYHSDNTLNFMLNRMSYLIEPEELYDFAKDISGLDEWIEAALEAGEQATDPGVSACYFRGAEFFMAPEHPRKTEAYDRFMDGFAASHPNVSALRSTVSFNGGDLNIIDIPAKGAEKDVILACSGFDGLIEEMYHSMIHFTDAGYRVVLYEGTGQGAALRRSHLPMQFDWEKPVSKILDDLHIESCTLLGLSLGGYLAPRAAAFEPRVKRLIAWGPMFEFFDCFRPRMGDDTFAGMNQLLDEGQADVVNELLLATMDQDATTRWSITHGIHTCGGKTPYDFFTWARHLNLRDVSSQITQDTLILGASKDHLVPTEQIWRQASALTNAKSVTARLFTEHEGGENHCQVGNPEIAIKEILNWLNAIEARDQRE